MISVRLSYTLVCDNGEQVYIAFENANNRKLLTQTHTTFIELKKYITLPFASLSAATEIRQVLKWANGANNL